MEAKAERFDRREYFLLEESEDIFGIPSETVRKWIHRDGRDGIPKLQAFKPGKKVMIKRKDMELYIKQFPVTAA